MPTGIEPCRNPVVFEKTSTRGRSATLLAGVSGFRAGGGGSCSIDSAKARSRVAEAAQARTGATIRVARWIHEGDVFMSGCYPLGSVRQGPAVFEPVWWTKNDARCEHRASFGEHSIRDHGSSESSSLWMIHDLIHDLVHDLVKEPSMISRPPGFSPLSHAGSCDDFGIPPLIQSGLLFHHPNLLPTFT